MLIWKAWALIPSQFPYPSHSFLLELGWWELALFVPQTSASLALALPHLYQGSALLPGEKWVTSQLPCWRSLDLFGSVSLSPLSNPSCPRTAARCPNCHRSGWEFMSLLPFSPPWQLCATAKQHPENMVHFPGGRQQCVCEVSVSQVWLCGLSYS